MDLPLQLLLLKGMEEAGMNNFLFSEFDTAELLVEALANQIALKLNEAIKKKNKACLAVSGGSTPKKLFEKLSHKDLEWEKVVVTLVDERWVDVGSTDSNENLVKTHLLINKAKAASFIGLKNDATKASEGVVILEDSLHTVASLDVVVLGMGNDAHTASFFPHAKELKKALETKQKCCATTASVEPKERMTLSRSFLLSADFLCLHIEGEAKRAVFDNTTQSDDIDTMPIIAMMQQSKPLLEVFYAK